MKRSESKLIYEAYLQKIEEDNPQSADIDWFEVVEEEDEDITPEMLSNMRERVFERLNSVSCPVKLRKILKFLDQSDS